MILVTGSATARGDSFDEVRQLSLEHVNRSPLEPGCLSHAMHIDCENPLRLVFLEQWADRAALGARCALPASRDFVRALKSLAAAASTVKIFDATRVESLFTGAHSWIATPVSYCNATYVSLDMARKN